MKWTDTSEIASALTKKFADIDPHVVRHTQLHAWVLELYHFNDEPDNHDDNMLKTIQKQWIGEFEKANLT